MYETLWQISAILIAYSSALVHSETYPECANIEQLNTYVASQSSCARYIYCDGDKSFEGECLADNYFNEVAGNCDDRESVVCLSSGEGVTSVASGGSIVNATDTGSNGSGVNSSGLVISEVDIGRNDLIAVLEEVKNQVTNVSGGPVSVNLQTESSIVLNTLSSFNNNPPVMESFYPQTSALTSQCPLVYGLGSVVYLPNLESCSSFYTCYNGIAIPMNCDRNMYFNEQLSKCERQERVYCRLNQPVRLECSKGIYGFIPHPRNCEYYYFCSNGFLMIFQCPFQFKWHYERRTCVHQTQAKCFSNSMLREMMVG